MARLTTYVPLFQPTGRLSIPDEAWSSLRSALLERFNARLTVTEAARPGFVVIGHTDEGLPCLFLELEFPDDVDREDLVHFVNPILFRLISRHCVSSAELQAA